MYSKDKGITRREPAASLGDRRPIGDRQPAYRQNRTRHVQVPPNYSGHAIVDGEERPLGSTIPTEIETPLAAAILPPADTPTPRFEGLPRISDLGDIRRHSLKTLPPSVEVQEPPAADPPSSDEEVPSAATPTVAAPPNSPSPDYRTDRGSSLFNPSRFLSGHGFGLEEILILGLILFLLRENGDGADRGDLDETLILLGLLLVLG